MKAVYILKRDPVGELLIAREDDSAFVPISYDDAKSLGATDDERREAMNGYRIQCSTSSAETLDALVEMYQ